jgi:hypothetical protein
MSKFYRGVLRPTLAARVAQTLEESDAIGSMDLGEELALMRDAVALRVGLYAELVERQAAGEPITRENLVAAGEIMKGGLEDVAKMVEAHARVERVKQEVASGLAGALGAVIQAVLICARDAFGDDYRVRKFEEALRAKLRERSPQGSDGTLLTPDRDAIEMDNSIPNSTTLYTTTTDTTITNGEQDASEQTEKPDQGSGRPRSTDGRESNGQGPESDSDVEFD